MELFLMKTMMKWWWLRTLKCFQCANIIWCRSMGKFPLDICRAKKFSDSANWRGEFQIVMAQGSNFISIISPFLIYYQLFMAFIYSSVSEINPQIEFASLSESQALTKIIFLWGFKAKSFSFQSVARFFLLLLQFLRIGFSLNHLIFHYRFITDL